MNAQATEAYRYYKDRYPPFIIFFRVGQFYNSYFEDAQIVSTIIGIPMKEMCVSIDATQIFDIIEKLSSSGLSSKMVSCRDDKGDFDTPDGFLIRAEEELDY